jgi:hypothetical protein
MDRPHAPASGPIAVDPAVLWTAGALDADWNQMAQAPAVSRRAIEHSPAVLAQTQLESAEQRAGRRTG